MLGSQDRPTQVFSNSPSGVSGWPGMGCLAPSSRLNVSEQTKSTCVEEAREAATA